MILSDRTSVHSQKTWLKEIQLDTDWLNSICLISKSLQAPFSNGISNAAINKRNASKPPLRFIASCNKVPKRKFIVEKNNRKQSINLMKSCCSARKEFRIFYTLCWVHVELKLSLAVHYCWCAYRNNNYSPFNRQSALRHRQ